jgi:hypothetical protein
MMMGDDSSMILLLVSDKVNEGIVGANVVGCCEVARKANRRTRRCIDSFGRLIVIAVVAAALGRYLRIVRETRGGWDLAGSSVAGSSVESSVGSQ